MKISVVKCVKRKPQAFRELGGLKEVLKWLLDQQLLLNYNKYYPLTYIPVFDSKI